MKTDACVHPYPHGDTSLERMAIEANELGFGSFVYTGERRCPAGHDILFLHGTIISARSMKDIIPQVRDSAIHGDIIMVNAGDAGFNRAVLSYGGIHMLREIQNAPRFSFDHISARFAAEKRIAVNLSVKPIIQKRGIERQRTLQCYADILRLHRRYHFPISLSSDASSYVDLRSPRDFSNLCSVFGMKEEEVDLSLSAVDIVRESREPIEVFP